MLPGVSKKRQRPTCRANYRKTHLVAVLPVWKLMFNGNIPDEALWIIGVLEIVLVMIRNSLNT